jgi:hypothetical protein
LYLAQTEVGPSYPADAESGLKQTISREDPRRRLVASPAAAIFRGCGNGGYHRDSSFIVVK